MPIRKLKSKFTTPFLKLFTQVKIKKGSIVLYKDIYNTGIVCVLNEDMTVASFYVVDSLFFKIDLTNGLDFKFCHKMFRFAAKRFIMLNDFITTIIAESFKTSIDNLIKMLDTLPKESVFDITIANSLSRKTIHDTNKCLYYNKSLSVFKSKFLTVSKEKSDYINKNVIHRRLDIIMFKIFLVKLNTLVRNANYNNVIISDYGKPFKLCSLKFSNDLVLLFDVNGCIQISLFYHNMKITSILHTLDPKYIKVFVIKDYLVFLFIKLITDIKLSMEVL